MAQKLTSVVFPVGQDIPDGSDNTEDLQQVARDNIGALGKVQWTRAGGQTGETAKATFSLYSNLSQGTETQLKNDLNDDNKWPAFIMVPVPNYETQAGKVLSVSNSPKMVKWEDPKSNYDATIKHEFFRYAGGPDDSTILELFEVPTNDGKWPTKIIGNFNCKPEEGYTTISVLPLVRGTYMEDGEEQTPSTYPFSPNSNYSLYNYYPYSINQINNISYLNIGKHNSINFSFQKKEDENTDAPNPDNNIKYIAIKGKSSTDSTHPINNYNISNISITYFYENA